MNSKFRNRRISLLVLLATLALRAAIPDGYMPAARGSGLLFEMCPTGVPADLMQSLAGSAAHHHHDPAAEVPTHLDAAQCPIGHLLSAAFAVDLHFAQDVPPVASDTILYHGPSARSAVRPTHRSRGPPAPVLQT